MIKNEILKDGGCNNNIIVYASQYLLLMCLFFLVLQPDLGNLEFAEFRIDKQEHA